MWDEPYHPEDDNPGGFGQAATLRQHFGAARGTTPLQYRRTFGRVDA